jgi:hypothetical protein
LNLPTDDETSPQTSENKSSKGAWDTLEDLGKGN